LGYPHPIAEVLDARRTQPLNETVLDPRRNGVSDGGGAFRNLLEKNFEPRIGLGLTGEGTTKPSLRAGYAIYQ